MNAAEARANLLREADEGIRKWHCRFRWAVYLGSFTSSAAAIEWFNTLLGIGCFGRWHWAVATIHTVCWAVQFAVGRMSWRRYQAWRALRRNVLAIECCWSRTAVEHHVDQANAALQDLGR